MSLLRKTLHTFTSSKRREAHHYFSHSQTVGLNPLVGSEPLQGGRLALPTLVSEGFQIGSPGGLF